VFEHVIRAPEVREVVLTLDLQTTVGAGPVHEEYSRSRFSDTLQPVEYHGGLLLGEDATRASFRLLSDVRRGRTSPYSERGFTNPALRGRIADREGFLWALARTIESARAPKRERAGDANAIFSRLEADIRAARARGLAVTVVVLPSHAVFLETMQRFGSWPDIERTREAFLRAITDERGETLVPVWDFTSWAGPAAEAVPARGSATEMRWHWDAVHVKPEAGSEVIAQIRSGETPRHLTPGERLTLESLAPGLERLRGEREQFLRSHADQLGLIDEATAEPRP
jgi:hypothetical protein